MDAKKCDACGGFYEIADPSNSILSVVGVNIEKSFGGYKAGRVFELCPACRKKIADILHLGIKKEK